jgi:maleate cis-trans isomerase
MDRRLHIGLMIPANTTTMERGLLAWLPEQSVGSWDALLTYDILEPLQSAFGKPEMSSVQVTAQEVLRAAEEKPFVDSPQ